LICCFACSIISFVVVGGGGGGAAVVAVVAVVQQWGELQHQSSQILLCETLCGGRVAQLSWSCCCCAWYQAAVYHLICRFACSIISFVVVGGGGGGAAVGRTTAPIHHKYSFVRHCVEAVLLSCRGLVVAVLGIKPQFTT
jgi:hypothetical protein